MNMFADKASQLSRRENFSFELKFLEVFLTPYGGKTLAFSMHVHQGSGKNLFFSFS
jgi:hypothetical protein